MELPGLPAGQPLTIPDDAEKESFALLDERLLNTPAVAVARSSCDTSNTVPAKSIRADFNASFA